MKTEQEQYKADAPNVECQFAAVSARLIAQNTAVEQGRMLHAPGLKVSGTFFAFASKGDICIKIPAGRVRALLAAGIGRPLEIRKGSPLREWIRVTPASEDACTSYLIEALDFVAHQQRR